MPVIFIGTQLFRPKIRNLEKVIPVLSDREKMVLHFSCTVTIAKLGNLPHRNVVIENMISDIRKERCRSLSEDDVIALLDEINEEMIGGKNMFADMIDERHPDLTDEEIWSRTGEWPKKKRTDWRKKFR